MTIIKKVVTIMVVLVIVLVALVAALLLLVNPNDYKDEISKLVEDASGYELALQGDLQWSLYPVLGFQTENLSVAVKDSAPFLSLQQAKLGLELMPLLRKQVKADSLYLNGMELNLVVDKDGNNNWAMTKDKPKSKIKSELTQVDTETNLPSLQINGIELVSIHILYRDVAAQVEHSLQVHSLALENVGLQQTVSLMAELEWKDQAQHQVQASIKGNLKVDEQLSQLEFNDLAINSTASGFTQNPTTALLDLNGLANLTQDTLNAQANLTVLDTKLHSTWQVTALSNNPKVMADLSAKNVAVKKLLSDLEIALPETNNPNAFANLNLTAKVQADVNSAEVFINSVQLDQTKINGQFSVRDFAKPVYGFEVNVDQINVDDYLPPAVAEENTPAAKEGSSSHQQQELIPVELLRSLEVDGKASIRQLTYQEMLIEDTTVIIKSHNGVFTIAPFSAKLLQGSVKGEVTVNAQAAEPTVQTTLDIKDIELAELTKPYMQQQLVSGKTSFALNSHAQGNDVETLINEAIGKMNLEVLQGVLHGINLNQIVVDALHEQLGSFDKVFPGYQSYLPKEVKEDTDISQLFANAKIENGKLIMPQFKFASDSGDIQAKGDVHLMSQGFDYQFDVHLSELDRNKYLKNTAWPLRCKGSLDSPVAEWCKPNTKQIKRILSDAAKLALKDKSAKELGDQVGLDVESREQLDDEVDAKLKQEEERAKRKLQEKLNKWLKRK